MKFGSKLFPLECTQAKKLMDGRLVRLGRPHVRRTKDIAVSQKLILSKLRWAKNESFSHFFNKKYWHIWDINIWNFNETLTNDSICFEQLGPDFENPEACGLLHHMPVSETEYMLAKYRLLA